MPNIENAQVASTGIAGLDDVLRGGLPPNRIYLIKGQPGVGKTTLGLQFLLAGAARGELGLYITLSETKNELAGRRRLARMVTRQVGALRARGLTRWISARRVHDVPPVGGRAQ